MKKFFSIFCLFAMTMAGVFVSCGGDDDPVIVGPEEPEAEPTYAKLVVKLSEDFFAYGDFEVTLEYDGQTKSYKLDENMKSANVDFEGLESFKEGEKIAGRVLEVPAFEYKSSPVKYNGKFVLSEEGKKKIEAATPEKEEIDVFICAMLVKCDKNGAAPGSAAPEKRAWKGVYVSDLVNFIDIAESGTSMLFNQSL